eukprot:gene19682-24117_t
MIPAHKAFKKAIGRPFQLSRLEFTVLSLLETNNELSQKALCECIGLATPNLTVILSQMERKGLIKRQRKEQDRRSQWNILTEHGRELVSSITPIAKSMEFEIL